MNTIRTALLLRFSSFCNVGTFILGTMTIQPNQNNNSL